MNAVWIVVGVAVIGVIAAITRWWRRGRPSELGFVSNRWVAEHRMSQQHDSQQ